MGWIALLLLLVVGVVGFLWWLSLRQINAVMHFFLMTLLSEENYRKHRDNLRSLASDVKAENAAELLIKVEYIVRNLIWKGDRQKLTIAVASLLWEAKQSKKIQPSP